MAAGALSLSGCMGVKSGTVIGLKADSPHMSTHAFSWETPKGLARVLVSNEVLDLNGDGILERHDYLGMRQASRDTTFYPNEKITLSVYAVAPRVVDDKRHLEYTLINPAGVPVGTDSISMGNLEQRDTYVVPNSEKMPGRYSLKMRILDGGRSKSEQTIPIFEIKE